MVFIKSLKSDIYCHCNYCIAHSNRGYIKIKKPIPIVNN